MKLMEASAVFLIIGGVLLGPIEGKKSELPDFAMFKKTDFYSEKMSECYGIHGGAAEVFGPSNKSYTVGFYCEAVYPLAMYRKSKQKQAGESIALTCERAMREIGAYERSVPLGKDSCVDLGGGVRAGPKTDMGQFCRSPFWALDKERDNVKAAVRVTCIPAPSGLVK